MLGDGLRQPGDAGGAQPLPPAFPVHASWGPEPEDGGAHHRAPFFPATDSAPLAPPAASPTQPDEAGAMLESVAVEASFPSEAEDAVAGEPLPLEVFLAPPEEEEMSMEDLLASLAAEEDAAPLFDEDDGAGWTPPSPELLAVPAEPSDSAADAVEWGIVAAQAEASDDETPTFEAPTFEAPTFEPPAVEDTDVDMPAVEVATGWEAEAAVEDARMWEPASAGAEAVPTEAEVEAVPTELVAEAAAPEPVAEEISAPVAAEPAAAVGITVEASIAGAEPVTDGVALELAERLEEAARRLRDGGSGALLSGVAGDRFDVLLAGLLTGYLAAHGD